jgi:S1-C subfamily serine protease
MKTFTSRIATWTSALALTFLPFAQAQDSKSDEEKVDEILGQFQETFGVLLKKALEDALGAWDKEAPEASEFEDLLGRLFHGEGSDLKEEDLEKWLGGDFLERLQEGLGDDFRPDLDPGDIEGFSRLLGEISQLRRPGDFEKEHKEIIEAYLPVSKTGSKSTIVIRSGEKQIALGTIITENGFILTKASELGGKTDFDCVLQGGMQVKAQRIDVYTPHDLALLKINAGGLTPVQWADDLNTIQNGTFVLATGNEDTALAVGVVSVLPRSLADEDKGFLGVQLAPTEQGVSIRKVVADSPAFQAGLQNNDIVQKLNDQKIDTVKAFIDEVGAMRPGTQISIQILRGTEQLQLEATLTDRSTIAGSGFQFDQEGPLGGRLSANRNGYPNILQTDLTLRPEECGGPLFNLDGKAIGINIARSGRVMSYAIPANSIRELIGDLSNGKFALVDIKGLKNALKQSEEDLAIRRTELQKAEEALKEAQKALDEASN